MKRNDFVLIGVVLLAALLFAGYHFLSADPKAGRVRVTVDGEDYGIYELSEEQTIDINGTNTLVIAGGEADMTDADCPDKLCVHQRAVSRDGESIICLPNKVVVSVESRESSDLDAVTN